MNYFDTNGKRENDFMDYLCVINNHCQRHQKIFVAKVKEACSCTKCLRLLKENCPICILSAPFGIG